MKKIEIEKYFYGSKIRIDIKNLQISIMHHANAWRFLSTGKCGTEHAELRSCSMRWHYRHVAFLSAWSVLETKNAVKVQYIY